MSLKALCKTFKANAAPILALWAFQAFLLSITYLWLVVNRSTMNHAFYSIAFTPLYVSDDLLWLQPFIVLSPFLGLWFLLRFSLQWSWRYTALLATLWVIPFPALHFCSRFYEPPGPGSLLPLTAYWGFGFSEYAGRMFVMSNLFLFLLFITFPLYLLWKNRAEQKNRFRYVVAVIILPGSFLLALSPFFVLNVAVYGVIGHYVDHRCQAQISELHLALLRYAAEHDNCLPQASDYAELWPIIKPYVKEADANTIWERFDHCVIGHAQERNPRPFLWNKKFSGKEIVYDESWWNFFGDEQKANPNSPAFAGLGDFYVAGEKWIRCPYGEERNYQTFRNTVELPREEFAPEKFRVVGK
jgi:hypothetical protein